jgi:hypothetical protein
MTHTNPKTNTTSEVEVSLTTAAEDPNGKVTSYTIATDIIEIAEMLKKSVFFTPGMMPRLTFNLWCNTKVLDVKHQFNQLMKVFDFKIEDMRVNRQSKRLYVEKDYGSVRISIATDAEYVLERRYLPSTTADYFYNETKIIQELD